MPNVSYQALAPYEIQGSISASTTDLWVVFHGFGQLAARFLQKFQVLDHPTQVVVAPQGPDRFYFDHYRKVGASWTTREERDLHLSNQQAYLDAVWATLALDRVNPFRIHVVGFSQGVSVVTRWIASRKQPVDTLTLWAGGFPEDLQSEDWTFLPSTTRVFCYIGDQDELITPERLIQERDKITNCFPQAHFRTFSGGHQIPEEALASLVVEILEEE